MPADSLDLKLGIVAGPPSNLRIEVDGVPWELPWPDYALAAGDVVKILTVNGEAAVFPFRTGPQPLLGDVPSGATPVGGYITVEGVDGVTYQARYDGDPPAGGTRVLMTFPGKVPWVRNAVVAGVGTDPVGPAVGPPPPTPGGPGSTTLVPVYAGTWRPNFNRFEAGDVVQGSYGSYTYRGAWFYGAAGTTLAGKTVTGISLIVGPRDNGRGNYNDPLPMQLQIAGGQAPSNWPSLAGPHPVVIPARWPGGPENPIPLPPEWAAHLAAGHGIGISGGAYMGFAGNAPSGQLNITWRT